MNSHRDNADLYLWSILFAYWNAFNARQSVQSVNDPAKDSVLTVKMWLTRKGDIELRADPLL